MAIINWIIHINSHVLAKHTLSKKHWNITCISNQTICCQFDRNISTFGILDMHPPIYPPFLFFLAHQLEHDIFSWPNQPRSWIWHLLLTLFAVGAIKSRIALADVGKYAWSAIFTFRLANCWEKKNQLHKLIRRMM